MAKTIDTIVEDIYNIFECDEDGGESGNRKLVPLIARHGGGLSDDFDYINMHLNGE